MTEDKVVYRIFLSPPGGVNFERHIVRQEAQKIFEEPNFTSHFDYEIVYWDDPDSPSPLLANQTPQSTLRRHLEEATSLIVYLAKTLLTTSLTIGAAYLV